jgi:hypothetical protein
LSPAPAPEKKSRWRGCCGCCLAAIGAPLLVLLVLLIWVSVGPAPAPADCLPPDAPLRVVVRDPAGLLGELLAGERWAPVREKLVAENGRQKLDPGQLRWAAFGLKRLAGSELALAGDGKDVTLAAMRPGALARAAERLLRANRPAGADGVRDLAGDGKVFYAMIGKTLLASGKRGPVAAALERKEAILGGKASVAPPADARVEVRFDAALGGTAEDREARMAALALDLPSPAKCAGWLRADRELRKLTGQAEFLEIKGSGPLTAGSPAPSVSLPPPLPPGGPISARLVPADALGYWVWQASGGAGRWSAAGRLKGLLEALGPDAAGLRQTNNELRESGVDAEKLIAQELSGERAAAVVSQPIPGGQGLQVAASVMVECREPAAAWPLLRKALERLYTPVSADGKAPVVVGKALDPYLARREHRGVEILELVYQTYPHGSGYRPAFGVAGKFAVFSTSRMELERMIDRAAAPPAPRAQPLYRRGAAPLELLVLAPQQRGPELVNLLLAAGHAFSEPGREPGQQEERQADVLGAMLSELQTLRVEWLAGDNGRLRLELEAELGGR